jgi:hypothetical protein
MTNPHLITATLSIPRSTRFNFQCARMSVTAVINDRKASAAMMRTKISLSYPL